MIGIKMDNAQVMAATSQTLRRLGELTGFSQLQVLRGFAGVVLKTWAGRTKVSTDKQVDRRTRYKVVRGLGYTKAGDRGDITVNAGYKPAPYGRVWIKARKGFGRKNFILAMGPNFTKAGGSAVFNPYSKKAGPGSGKWLANVMDAVDDVRGGVNRAIPLGRQSVGLSRGSVVHIADSLGIDLMRVVGGGTISTAGLEKARSAIASSGKFYRNGFGREGGTKTHDFVDLVNTLPYARKIGMDKTLLRILSGQAKYFERSYATGAFDTQAKAARAYPNLFRVSRTFS